MARWLSPSLSQSGETPQCFYALSPRLWNNEPVGTQRSGSGFNEARLAKLVDASGCWIADHCDRRVAVAMDRPGKQIDPASQQRRCTRTLGGLRRGDALGQLVCQDLWIW